MALSVGRLDEMRRYEIVVGDDIDERDFNRTSPIAVGVEKETEGCCLLVVTTDQAGLVGLLRHLHQLGIVMVTILRKGGDNEGRENGGA